MAPTQDPNRTPRKTLLGILAVGVAAACVVGWTTEAHGEEIVPSVRPEYQNLGDCAPRVTRFDQGDIEYTVPLDCPANRWHHATHDLAPFGGRHVLAPQPVVCDISFTIAAGEARGVDYYTDVPGGCDTATVNNDPKGTFIVHLPLGSCGTQKDMWLDGVDQPYAAQVLEHVDGCTTPPTTTPYPMTLGPALPASEDVLSAAQAPPLATVDDTSGGGEQVTLSPTAPSLPPAAAQTAVAGVYAERTLPATGRGPVGALVGGLTLILGALLVGTGWVIRKDGRS